MRARTVLVATLSALTLLVATPAGVAADPAPTDPAPAAAAPAAEEAQDALADAQQLLREPTHHARRTAPDPHRDATLAFRELAVRVDDLPAEDRREARAVLARPTTPTRPGRNDWEQLRYEAPPVTHCSTNLCFHWVESTDDAPPMADADANGRPDQVDLSVATFEDVWQKVVVEMGYQAPKPDGRSAVNGGTPATDIYLAELSRYGLFGYCTTDDPALAARHRDVSSYCVVDDDFALSEFGDDPVESLRVTAAHEFFHSVQFGYDVLEDVWLMEGSAMWMEDEVYDDIDANIGYLRSSPLRFPWVPVDYIGEDQELTYGSWIFWRFLSEYVGPGRSSDSTVVRQVWRLAADRHSLDATRAMLARRGISFARAFADFGAVNRRAKQWYDEGRAYPSAPTLASFRLTRTRPGTVWRSVTMNHLANEHVAFRPDRSLRGQWRLRLDLDLAPRLRGSAATVTVNLRGGGVRTFRARLDRRGDDRLTVPFSRATVASVALTLTNASTRTRCWQGTSLACQGLPRDDGLRYSFRATALRLR